MGKASEDRRTAREGAVAQPVNEIHRFSQGTAGARKKTGDSCSSTSTTAKGIGTRCREGTAHSPGRHRANTGAWKALSCSKYTTGRFSRRKRLRSGQHHILQRARLIGRGNCSKYGRPPSARAKKGSLHQEVPSADIFVPTSGPFQLRRQHEVPEKMGPAGAAPGSQRPRQR